MTLVGIAKCVTLTGKYRVPVGYYKTVILNYCQITKIFMIFSCLVLIWPQVFHWYAVGISGRTASLPRRRFARLRNDQGVALHNM